MRTVVLGAPGQLGRDLCPRLPGDVVPLSRADVELTDEAALRGRLTELRPGVVVNCAAYNFVDKAESEPIAAFAVNAWAVRGLATVCRDLDVTLIHFSTDYVFGLDSTRTVPFAETDAPGPVSVYGLSKLAGEYFVQSICPKHFVLRTCGLFGVWGSGGKGGNFVETMLRAAGQGKPLRVVADQVCTPSSTVDVAAATAELIKSEAYGLYHVTNDGSCSWYEFARHIFATAGIQANLTPVTAIEFGAAARRPTYSVLSNEKLKWSGVKGLRPWTEALDDYLGKRSKR